MSAARCSCGRPIRRPKAPSVPEGVLGRAVELLRRHPRLAGIAQVAESLDMQARWSA